MDTGMNDLTACQSCGASAEGCQLKHHFGGRECCTDCHHETQGHDADVWAVA